ncbi:hypothetical protein [Nocardia sp. NBC_00511]|uniref:hypothetical protein n=1 Tax=Nocardia sp. NBC_00511 TaxID=2903591 RepID=UPI002F9068A3
MPGTTFAAAVRRSGRALIDAGGGQALETVHRTLIGLYLNSLNIRERYDTIARVARGYRRWLISQASVVGEGSLDVVAVLEEGFLAVVRNGESESDAAKALHQIVVSAVRRSG